MVLVYNCRMLRAQRESEKVRWDAICRGRSGKSVQKVISGLGLARQSSLAASEQLRIEDLLRLV